MLATKVGIVRTRRGGRLVIDFYSDEELDRIYAIITRGAGSAERRVAVGMPPARAADRIGPRTRPSEPMTAQPAARDAPHKARRDYTAANIQVLEGLEAVRKRPGMYIGSTDARGLHQLVWEVVDNSIDEAMADVATRIDVTIHADGSVEVRRRRPRHPGRQARDRQESRWRSIMTVLHAGGKFGGGGYKVSGGLHGVGRQRRQRALEPDAGRGAARRQACAQEYERGDPDTAVAEAARRRPTAGWTQLDAARTARARSSGPIRDLRDLDFSWELIARGCARSAYLNKGLWIRLVRRARSSSEKNFYFEGGVASFVRHLNRRRDTLNARPIYVESVVEAT